MKQFLCIIVVICIVLTINCNSFAQSGIITTFAGNGVVGYSGDGGPATNAMLNNPWGIFLDQTGDILISDEYNNRIRKVDISGNISTLAGNGSLSGGDGGPATAAGMHWPYGVIVDSSGNMYFADSRNELIRKVNTAGIIITIAGNGSTGYSGDGGPATAATLNNPTGIRIDKNGNLIFADTYNNCIRMINSSGIITTIAGTGVSAYSGDGGAATAADLYSPANLAIDNIGNILVSDYNNNCIRKIDTFGIISTIAGTGIAGFSGDEGPAISAEINGPGGITLDYAGNIYFTDYNNNRIRTINTLGRINTIAGSGTAGYSGDGGLATVAQFNGPFAIVLDQIGNLFFSDFNNQRIRKFQILPSYVADSFSVFIDNMCGGLFFNIVTNSYSIGQHVVTYYGNGTYIDTPTFAHLGHGLCNIYVPFLTGTYTIKHVLYDGSIPVDSIMYTQHFSGCQNFTINFYNDVNNDCAFDLGDNYLSVPLLVEVDSNGISIDTISCTSGLYYNAFGNPGDIYNFKIISSPGELIVTCPASGIITDTIQSIYTPNGVQYVAFQCTGTGTGFDLSVADVISATGIHDQWGNIYVSNIYSCDSVSATVTAHYSQNYLYEPSLSVANPLPTSYTDSSITWNLSGLTVSAGSPVNIFYQVWDNPSTGLVTIGDLAQTYVVVTPYTGDIDTMNNSCVINDTVKSGCDPNEMLVKPQGIIPPAVVTPLQYTIDFMNTGNDTAFNIYVMDTLSANVDISTFRMVMASAQMNISKYQYGSQNIIKFDFPGINLNDSAASPAQSSGAVIFNINTIAGLPIGATVFNHAGVFFDDNPVVTTNTVEDIVGWPSGINTLHASANSKVDIYPNPANETLTIKTDGISYSTYTVTNTLGVVILQQAVTGNITTVDIKALPAGMYFIELSPLLAKGSSVGNMMTRFIKE